MNNINTNRNVFFTKKKGLALLIATMMLFVIFLGMISGIFATNKLDTETTQSTQTTETVAETKEGIPEVPAEEEEKPTNNTQKQVEPENNTDARDLDQQVEPQAALESGVPRAAVSKINIPDGETLVLDEAPYYHFASDPVGTAREYMLGSTIEGASPGVSTIDVKGNVNFKRVTGSELNIIGGGALDISGAGDADKFSDLLLASSLKIDGNTKVNVSETRYSRASNVTNLAIESGSELNINGAVTSAFAGSNVIVKGKLAATSANGVVLQISDKLVVDGGEVIAQGMSRSGLEVADGNYGSHVIMEMKNGAKVKVTGDDNFGGALHVTNLNMDSGSELTVEGSVGINAKYNVNVNNSTLKVNTSGAKSTRYGINIQGDRFNVNNSTVQVGTSGSYNVPARGIELNGDIVTNISNNSNVSVYAYSYGISDRRANNEFIVDNSKMHVESLGLYGIVLYGSNQTFTVKNGAKVDLFGQSIGAYLTDANVNVSGQGTVLNTNSTHETSDRVWGIYISNDTDNWRGNIRVSEGAIMEGEADHWAGIYAAGDIFAERGGQIFGKTKNLGVGVHSVYNIDSKDQGSLVSGLSPQGTGIRVEGSAKAENGGKIEGTTQSADQHDDTQSAYQRGIEIHNDLTINNGIVVGNAIEWSSDHGAIIADGNIQITDSGQLIENYKTAQVFNENYKIPFENIKTIGDYANYEFSLNEGSVEKDATQGIKATASANGATLTATRGDNVEDSKMVIETSASHTINTTPVDLLAPEPTIYTVIFDGNGATTQANPMAASVTLPANKLATLPSNPAKTGSTFQGWNTKQDGSGQLFTTDTEITESITVYAQWQEETIDPEPVIPETPQGPDTPATPGGPNTPVPPTETIETPDALAPITSPLVQSLQGIIQSRTAGKTPSTYETVVKRIEEGVPTIEIDENKVPLHSESNTFTWALVNLIISVTGLIVSLIVIFTIFNKKKEQDKNGENKQNRKPFLKWLSVIISVISIAVFFITENLSLPMGMVDQWTILMVVFAIVQVGFLVLTKIKRNKNNVQKIEQVTDTI